MQMFNIFIGHIHIFETGMELAYSGGYHTGSEIALSWSPMRLKILHWRPEFYNWSPAGD